MNNLYKEIIGNALEPAINPTDFYKIGKVIITPHVCNNAGRFGAGFAKTVAEKYPEVKERYLQEITQVPTQLCLGDCQFIPVNMHDPRIVMKTFVVNMIAQDGVRGPNNPIPLKYEALIKCMVYIRESILPEMKFNSSIHCCKFGSGLAGGNWDFIKILIKEIWCDHGIPVTVYKL